MLERKFALRYFRVLLNKRFAYAACFTVMATDNLDKCNCSKLLSTNLLSFEINRSISNSEDLLRRSRASWGLRECTENTGNFVKY